MADQPEILDAEKKKTHKLQVWVGDELFAKIHERCFVTNRHESAWIRAVLEKHFSNEKEKKTKDELERKEILDRLEKIEKRIETLASRRG